jgi:hypothetical protein
MGIQKGVHIMTSLTDLANSYNSDKGNVYKCAHHYTKHYEDIFRVYKSRKNLSLLEIGLNRDDCSDIPSLRMYKDYFGEEINLYGFDIRPEFKAFEREGFNIYIGDQSAPSSLEQCLAKDYDIVIDDGSHASSHQQISLRELWAAVKPGGVYIIEDLHWQPFPESWRSTAELGKDWLQGDMKGSAFLSQLWMQQFEKELRAVELLPSASKLHDPSLTENALLILWKK